MSSTHRGSRRGVGPGPRPAFWPAAVLAIVSVLLSGCGPGDAESEGPSGRPVATDEMTEDAYVRHSAALAVALEEGLTGEAAAARARDLGGGEYGREDVEELAALLAEVPERWFEIERRVEERIAQLKMEIESEASEP